MGASGSAGRMSRGDEHGVWWLFVACQSGFRHCGAAVWHVVVDRALGSGVKRERARGTASLKNRVLSGVEVDSDPS